VGGKRWNHSYRCVDDQKARYPSADLMVVDNHDVYRSFVNEGVDDQKARYPSADLVVVDNHDMYRSFVNEGDDNHTAHHSPEDEAANDKVVGYNDYT